MSREPIILLGSHRSGTTWLGDVFGAHPRLAYWEEPRHVWVRGNVYTPDDRLTETHARPRVARRIRDTFDAYVREHGKDRLMEKTPSNTLRLRFIREVYPDAPIVFVVRDGRSVLRSTGEIMAGGVPMSKIITRARQTPLTEWPAFASQAAGALRRKITGAQLSYWGPRPPGWKDWVAHDHPDVVLAKQWAGCLGSALDDAEWLEREGRRPVLRFMYEDLLRRPRELMTELCDHCGLDNPEPVIERAESSADPARAQKWRAQLDDETLARVRPHMEPTLTRLRYTWDLTPTMPAPSPQEHPT